MISVTGVSMRYGSKVLFEDVTTTFSKGRRYGLTGPNGAGKSTFMKLLTGELEPQKGTVSRPSKLGVLRQDHYAFDQYRVIDTVRMPPPLVTERPRSPDRGRSALVPHPPRARVLADCGNPGAGRAYGVCTTPSRGDPTPWHSGTS